MERDGNEVHVYMTMIRSHFAPDNIEGVEVGDTVYFHVTNLEQDWDVPHGFAVIGAADGGDSRHAGRDAHARWVPQAPGVYPFYCTDFCSALHQEMQGYVRVSAPGSGVKLTAGVSERSATQQARAARTVPPSASAPVAPAGKGGR